mgnify:FL=1
MEQSGAVTEVTESVPSYEPPAGDASASFSEPPPRQAEEKAEAPPKAPVKDETDTPSRKPVPESIKNAKPKDHIQSRIAHYASETRAAREEAKQLREAFERVMAKQDGVKASTSPDGKPNPDDYPEYSQYVEALTDWKVEQRETKNRETQSKTEASEHFSKRYAAYTQEIDKFVAGFEDPNAVKDAMNSDDVPVTAAMGDAIMDLGAAGVEVMFHLSQHPHEAMQIAQMHPRMAVVMIGRLAERLEVQSKQSQAPQAQPQAIAPQASTKPQVPEPKIIPQVRGSSPASLDDEINDNDPPHIMAQKEARRMQRLNPGMRMYVPRG